MLKISKDKELFQLIIQDIKTYLKGDYQTEFTTTQHMIGMNNMFKGWVMKG